MLSTDAKLSELVNRLKELAGANLHSVVLYGSAARGDFHEQRSDLNVLAPAVQWWINEQHEPAPLFFTEEELRRSSDVFAIEILDIRDAHRVLHGKDPVAAINIPMNLHRVELEHELRTTLVKLRQHFLLASGNSHELSAVLAKSTSSVARTAAIAGVDASAFAAAFQLRETGETGADIVAVYGAYLQAIEKVIVALDQLIPKHEWQRVVKA